MSSHNEIVMSIRGLFKQFDDHKVLHDVNLEVARGQFVSLVGPSGCGKSTLLYSIVGTLDTSEGAVIIRDGYSERVVDGPGRDRGIVYQRYSLFPFLTALENVAFGPLLAESTIPGRLFARVNPFAAWRKQRKEHLARAEKMLVRFGLKEVLHKYPSMLSGGQQQRVAIAQALIMEPKILLMDEPFGAIDPQRREDLQRVMLELYAENLEAIAKDGKPLYTVVLVTHELQEAIFVGDRVVGLSQYWGWQQAGFASAPGATVVYDRKAPVFKPSDMRDLQNCAAQRLEILEVVYDEESSHAPGPYVTFWDDMAVDPDGHGVAR
jgi:NitT/TauT family transport system ATP-binding protein